MAAPYLVADFAKHFGPDPITAERAFDKPDATIRGFEQQPPRFGFRWFMPALASHRETDRKGTGSSEPGVSDCLRSRDDCAIGITACPDPGGLPTAAAGRARRCRASS